MYCFKYITIERETEDSRAVSFMANSFIYEPDKGVKIGFNNIMKKFTWVSMG